MGFWVWSSIKWLHFKILHFKTTFQLCFYISFLFFFFLSTPLKAMTPETWLSFHLLSPACGIWCTRGDHHSRERQPAALTCTDHLLGCFISKHTGSALALSFSSFQRSDHWSMPTSTKQTSKYCQPHASKGCVFIVSWRWRRRKTNQCVDFTMDNTTTRWDPMISSPADWPSKR